MNGEGVSGFETNNNNQSTKLNAPETNGDRKAEEFPAVFHNESVVINGDLILVNDYSALGETGSIASNDSAKSKTGMSTPMRIKRAKSLDILKEKAVDILQSQLEKAHQELQLKDERCQELTNIRTKLEEEIEELTASLFEEAHKMVREANEGKHLAVKREKEARGNIEALQAEVQALKSLVLTSTPAHPNPSMHPQLIKRKKEGSFNLIKTKSPDHHKNNASSMTQHTPPSISVGKEIDPILMSEVSEWYEHAMVSKKRTNSSTLKLLDRINIEDINPCLKFSDERLSESVAECVRNNSIAIEPITIRNSANETCALSKSEVICKYKIRLNDAGEWRPISQSCRNRITSVCDFLTFIRYAENGLIKQNKEQVYWQIINFRKEMGLSKLGFYKTE